MATVFDKLKQALRGRVLEAEPLSRHTTWRVGGPADLFVAPADRRDLQAALAILAEAGIPWFPLGGGSNLLVRDGGFRGAVLHTGRLRGLELSDDGEVLAEAGVPLMTLIRACAARGLAGLEALAGIPGTVGGGVVMNAGAGGQEMANVVREVVLAGPQGEETWDAERCRFVYRGSALPAERMVSAVRMRFREAPTAALEEEIRRRIAHRRSAHAVGGANAGSVFKNPPGHSAWKLIDAAGMRGERRGGARVSEVHTNFIVNDGSATAADILALMEETRQAVKKHSGIELEPEVKIVGDW